MSVAVEKRVGEPIIVLKSDAQVSMQEWIDAWFRSTEIAQTMEVAPYRIIDLRSTKAQAQVGSMIQSIVKGLSGAPLNLALNVAFVGSAPASSNAGDWFETLEDALNHIRALAGTTTLS